MKKMYYRTENVTKRSLIAMAVFAIAMLAIVEYWTLPSAPADKQAMLAASQRALDAFDLIAEKRKQLGHTTILDIDPARTRLLGPSISVVTSLVGHLDAKQTSVNPNFAAVVVKYLLRLEAQPGDRVAIGCTGSFPALNIAVITAVEQLGLEPVLISSAASSSFGANDPKFMWPDMERFLAEEGVIKTRSLAISRGGFRDNAVGMTPDTREVLDASIQRSGRPMFQTESSDDLIESRLRLYQPDGDLSQFVAYINVGGGYSSVGGTEGNDLLGWGWVEPSIADKIDEPIDSVAMRFLQADIPLINMVNVVMLANVHGLPVAAGEKIPVGDGGVYRSVKYRKLLAVGAIALVLLQVFVIIRPPVWWTNRMHSIREPADDAAEPSLMV